MYDGRLRRDPGERGELVVEPRLLDRDIRRLREEVLDQPPAVLGKLRLELELRGARTTPVEELDRQVGVVLLAVGLSQLPRLRERVAVTGATTPALGDVLLAKRLVEGAQARVGAQRVVEDRRA
jgi:hypothetical protein